MGSHNYIHLMIISRTSLLHRDHVGSGMGDIFDQRREPLEGDAHLVGVFVPIIHAHLGKISAELAARGYVTAGGKPYVASAVQTMLA
jgi:hypothetical protein